MEVNIKKKKKGRQLGVQNFLNDQEFDICFFWSVLTSLYTGGSTFSINGLIC